MSKTTISSNISTTKAEETEEISAKQLKNTTSDASVNSERMFESLEDVMSYIGSSYPHFWKSVLPIFIVSTFLFVASRSLSAIEKLKTLSIPEEKPQYFYSKCRMNSFDDSVKVAQAAQFMVGKVPKWELTVVMNAILMFTTTTVSPRKLALVSLTITSISYFCMANFPSQLQMSIYTSQIFTEIYRMVAMVNVAESVPKYHRMPALVLIEFGSTIARGLAALLIRMPADFNMNLLFSFELFGFLTICMGLLTYYTFHDSLYSLLAHSKTDQMQDRLTHIFNKSGIILAPDAVIDQIAFEHFENNEHPLEIATRTVKTFKCVQEMLVCGVISGMCLTVNSFAESSIFENGDVMFFEKMLIPTTSYTTSCVLLIGWCIWMPKHRILPVIILIPMLFISTTGMFLMKNTCQVYNECIQHNVIHSSFFPLYLAIGILTSAFSDMIRFFIKVHLIEVMPALIRVPVLAILYFVQYSFDGNLRDTYATEGIDDAMTFFLITFLAMLVLLINPRKSNHMNVFFVEYTKDTDKRACPPPPEVVKEPEVGN